MWDHMKNPELASWQSADYELDFRLTARHEDNRIVYILCRIFLVHHSMGGGMVGVAGGAPYNSNKENNRILNDTDGSMDIWYFGSFSVTFLLYF